MPIDFFLSFFQVVEATETYKRCLDYKFYMLEVQPSCYDEASNEDAETVPKMYVKAGHLVELEKFACTHGSGKIVFIFLFYITHNF